MKKGSNRHWSDEEISVVEEMFPNKPCDRIANHIDRSPQAIKHKARRLGITRDDNYRVLKKINSMEQPDFDNEQFSAFICGFVAGEGAFGIGDERVDGATHSFSISLADVDKDIIYRIQDYLNCGNVYEYESREEHWKDTVQFQAQSIGEIYNCIIPFFEQHDLQSTHKQKQYEEWRDSFLEKYDLTERFK